MVQTRPINELPLERVDGNTVRIATRTEDGIIDSFISVCPESIFKPSGSETSGSNKSSSPDKDKKP